MNRIYLCFSANLRRIFAVFLAIFSVHIFAQGSDILIVVDQSSPMSRKEYGRVQQYLTKIALNALDCDNENRIAVVSYAYDVGGNDVYIENDFTADKSKVTISDRNPRVVFSNNGDYAPRAFRTIANALDGIHNNNIRSPTKKLNRDPTKDFVILFFTDAERGYGCASLESSYLVDGGKDPFKVFNDFKRNYGATITVLKGKSTNCNKRSTEAAAAIASVGGNYNGDVEANAGDPEGSGNKPRRMIYTEDFTLSDPQIAELTESICSTCAPKITTVSPSTGIESLCNKTSATISVTANSQNGGALSYQWYRMTTTAEIEIPNATSNSYTTGVPGKYRVKIKAAGCGDAKVSPIFTIRGCDDPDEDEIGILEDLDNDNDGILDSVEKDCDQNSPPNGMWPTPNPEDTRPSGWTSPTKTKRLLFFDWSGVSIGANTNGTFEKSVMHNGVTYKARVEYSKLPFTLEGADLRAYVGGSTSVVKGYRYYNVNGNIFKEMLYGGAARNQEGSFYVTFTATHSNGMEIPIEAVFFDGESSGPAEYTKIELTESNLISRDIQLVEKWGLASSTTSGEAIADDGRSLTLTSNNVAENFSGLYSTFGYSPRIKVTIKNPASDGRQGVGLGILLHCDSDDDGIPNFLDADSDNDGCPDAVEGGDNVQAEHLDGKGRIAVLADATPQSNQAAVVSNLPEAYGVPEFVNPAAANSSGNSGAADSDNKIGQSAGTSMQKNAPPVAGSLSSAYSPAQVTLSSGNHSGVKFQWQKKISEDEWEDISGATNTSLSLPVNSGAGIYRLKVFGESGCYVTSGEIRAEGYCYKNPRLMPELDVPTNHGITALNRAGAETGNWPMVRQSGWTALEANTKGFVVNRVPKSSLSQIDAVEGMMVYDTTDECLKIFNGTEWKCLSVQSCPDNN